MLRKTECSPEMDAYAIWHQDTTCINSSRKCDNCCCCANVTGDQAMTYQVLLIILTNEIHLGSLFHFVTTNAKDSMTCSEVEAFLLCHIVSLHDVSKSFSFLHYKCERSHVVVERALSLLPKRMKNITCRRGILPIVSLETPAITCRRRILSV